MRLVAVATVAVVTVIVVGTAWATGPLLPRSRMGARPGAPVVQSGNADAPGPQHRLHVRFTPVAFLRGG